MTSITAYQYSGYISLDPRPIAQIYLSAVLPELTGSCRFPVQPLDTPTNRYLHYLQRALITPFEPPVPFCDRDLPTWRSEELFEEWRAGTNTYRGLMKRDHLLSMDPMDDCAENEDSMDVGVEYELSSDDAESVEDQYEDQDDDQEQEVDFESGSNLARTSSPNPHDSTWESQTPNRPTTAFGKNFIRPQGNFLYFIS